MQTPGKFEFDQNQKVSFKRKIGKGLSAKRFDAFWLYADIQLFTAMQNIAKNTVFYPTIHFLSGFKLT